MVATVSQGELGHMVVVPDGRPCGCGRKGLSGNLLFGYRRGPYYLGHARSITVATELRNIPREEITSYVVYKAAMAGDTLAREVFRQTGTRIGKACAEIATFLSPEAFIFFGGLAQAG